MSVKEFIGGGILGLSGLILAILGLVIHVWTIVLAFSFSGIFAAVLTLIFPVFSEIYWFLKVGLNIGFDNNYCLAIIAYVIIFVIAMIAGFFATSRD